MAEKIKLVQGDTRPSLLLDLRDAATGLPISVTGAIPRLKVKLAGASAVKEVLTGVTLPGYTNEDGSITTSGPYSASGSGGRVMFTWSALALDTAGDMVGEVDATFADGTVQTVYDLLNFKVRAQF